MSLSFPKYSKLSLVCTCAVIFATAPAVQAQNAEDAANTLKGVIESVSENDPAAQPPSDGLDKNEFIFEDSEASASGSTTISGPSAITESDLGEDAFYDTESIVPKGNVGAQGPAPVNPATQPASKFVIVDKVVPKDDQESQLVAAERAMSLGLYESAFQMYEGLYAKNKKDSRILMGKAVSLQKLGRYDEAMSTYEELSERQPNNLDVSINMLGLLATRYPAIALRRLIDLQEKNPNNIGLVGQTAVTAANMGDFETSLRYFGMAIGMQPTNASHLFNAAIVLDRAGKSKDAVSYYEKALEVDSIYGGGRSVPREKIYERLSSLR